MTANFPVVIPKFDIDENALQLGVNILEKLAIRLTELKEIKTICIYRSVQFLNSSIYIISV